MGRRLLALGLLLGLAACGFQPYDGPLLGSDMKPGPGLFSGPTGEFAIGRGTGPATPPAPSPTPPSPPGPAPAQP